MKDLYLLKIRILTISLEIHSLSKCVFGQIAFKSLEIFWFHTL